MKLASVFVLALILQAGAATMAQKVTLTKKNINISTVFQEIRKQTGYNVLWNSDKLNGKARIDADFKYASLQEVMKACLAGRGLEFTIEENTILIIPSKPLSFVERMVNKFENIDVSAQVVDEKGRPMAGANVKVKNTARFISTDVQGRFSLSDVDPKSIISISFLGYKTVEVAASKIKSVIALEIATSDLDEVKVTTAYGIEREKKELGYSVGKVSGEDLNRANSGSVLNGLVGKISGLNVMTQSAEMSPKMRILLRGIRSFGESSNNQPLFIFNGAPLSFGSDGESGQQAVDFINNLNPADIEDVTVLKGANGTAMYGPEGVNGVIIITTKKVKQGELSVNARVNTSFTQMDFRQRRDQRTFGLGNEVNFFGGRSTESWGPAYDGRQIAIGYPDVNGKMQMVSYSDKDDRYKFFDVARVTRTNVSLAQADQNSSVYLGAGYVDQTGLLPGDKQNQSTLLFNSSRKIGKSVDLLFNVNYARTKSDRGNDQTGAVLNMPSFIPLLSYKDADSYWGSLDTYWSGVNPYRVLEINRQKNTSNTFTGSFTLNARLLPWLSIKDQVSMNYLGINRKTNSEPVRFSQFARVDPLKAFDVEPTTEDYLATAYGYNNDLLVSTLHKTGDFVLRGNLGSTVRDNFEKQLKTKATLIIPVYNTIFARSDYGIGADEVTRQTRSISAFGNMSAGYKDRYFLELTARNEWDSKRAKVARGKDFYFGANASLLLKEIVPFLKEQSWLSSMRVRLSAAKTANMNIEPQQSERRLMLTYPYPYTDATTGKSVLSYALTQNPNPNILPEKVFSQEYGTEIGLFENRVRIDAAYYHQINNGVIMKVGVPVFSGYPDLDNAGRFRNTGWEFDLNLNPLVNFGEDINISLIGRFSINNNKVLQVSEIYNGVFIARDPNGNPFYAREGHSAFEFAALDFVRDPQGRVVVDAKSGLPSVDYQNPIITGKTLPVYQGGVTMNLNYKRFTFSAQADYSAGNDHAYQSSTILNGTNQLTLLNNRESFIFPNSVIQDSPGHYIENTNVAVSSAGKELFSRFADATIHSISSASYWKIRELSLRYQLPVKTKWIKRLDASIYARDLFSFYPSSNIFGDPVASNGPGLKTNAVQAVGGRQASQTNNISGGASDANATPGTYLYGFTIGLSF